MSKRPGCFHWNGLAMDLCQGSVKARPGIDILGRPRTDNLCERHGALELLRIARYDESLRHRKEIAETLASVPDRSVGGRESVAVWKSHEADCMCRHCLWTNDNLDSWEI